MVRSEGGGALLAAETLGHGQLVATLGAKLVVGCLGPDPGSEVLALTLEMVHTVGGALHQCSAPLDSLKLLGGHDFSGHDNRLLESEDGLLGDHILVALGLECLELGVDGSHLLLGLEDVHCVEVWVVCA